MLESLHFLTWKYAHFPLAKWFWARWFFKGSACFDATDTLTLSNHHSGIHFMTIVLLGSSDPHRKRLKSTLKECSLWEEWRCNLPTQKVWEIKVISKRWNKNSIKFPRLAYKMSSLIFFLKLNTQNLLVIFLKAKDYHSFPGTHDFVRHMLPSMFVLLQALLGEQWSFFFFFFLCYSFFQATARLRNGNNIAFWFKSYDCQSIRIRRNFLSEQKELCECCGQIFLSSLQWDLSSPLLPSPWECQPTFCQNCQRCVTVHRERGLV